MKMSDIESDDDVVVLNEDNPSEDENESEFPFEMKEEEEEDEHRRKPKRIPKKVTFKYGKYYLQFIERGEGGLKN